MSTPSLLNIPYLYKAGTLYSQIPESGAGDFTVTRATTPTAGRSTRINKNGLIELVADNVPRLDYPLGGAVNGCPALLVEPSGTNVLSYSEEFDNAAWGKSAMTVSTGTTALFTAPDGTTNADKIIATSGNVAHNINRSGLASAAYTFSVFAKAGEESVISLWLRGASVRAEFNLVSGTISNITVTSARIENYGNGWYRCTVYDSTAGTTAHVYGRGGGSYAGNGVDGFYLWGAQLELGSVPTSYIPTTTAAVTRSADVITRTSASALIGQSEGTIYLEVDAANAGTQFFRITPGAGSVVQNSIQIYKNSSGIYQARIYPSSSNFNIVDTAAKSGFVKIALAYKSGESALVINGGTPITSATAISFSETLNIVNFAAGVESLKPTRIRAAAIYPNRLTNAELAALTAP